VLEVPLEDIEREGFVDSAGKIRDSIKELGI